LLVKAIAGTNNLTKAAKKLNISQPALSRQLLDIESRLNTPLFIRAPKKMVLTAAGEIILNSAEKVLHEVESTEERISRIVGEQTGELKVGIGCPLSYQWLIPVMESFNARYPNVDFQIGCSPDHLLDLINNKFDVVITTKHPPNRKIKYQHLFTGQATAIFKPGHSFSGKSWLEIEDFQSAILISLVPKESDSFYNKLLRPFDIQLKNYLFVEQFQGIIELVKRGFGVSVLPDWSVSPYIKTRQIVGKPITEKGIRLDWKAAFLTNQLIPEYRNHFLSLVSESQVS